MLSCIQAAPQIGTLAALEGFAWVCTDQQCRADADATHHALQYFGALFLAVMFIAMGAMPQMAITMQHKR
jgi:hypothetical protein